MIIAVVRMTVVRQQVRWWVIAMMIVVMVMAMVNTRAMAAPMMLLLLAVMVSRYGDSGDNRGGVHDDNGVKSKKEAACV
jgi:hypothetical protein